MPKGGRLHTTTRKLQRSQDIIGLLSQTKDLALLVFVHVAFEKGDNCMSFLCFRFTQYKFLSKKMWNMV